MIYKEKITEMSMVFLHRVIFMLKLLVLAYVITVLLIALLALLVLKFDFNDTLIRWSVILIYFISNLVTTCIMLRLKPDKRLIRGTLFSISYMAGIILVSSLMNSGNRFGAGLLIAGFAALLGSIAAGIMKV